jgi:hypothetical protein
VKPHVRLYAAKGVGIVVPMRTGVVFVNQAGGNACMQPEMEGIYIPLDDDFNDIEAKLHEYFVGPRRRGSGATSGLDEADADRIDEILRSRHPPCPVTVDRSLLKTSVEAWVHVRLQPQTEIVPLFQGFERDAPAVLTWNNSD